MRVFTLQILTILSFTIKVLAKVTPTKHTIREIDGWNTIKNPDTCSSDCTYKLHWKPGDDDVQFRLYGKTGRATNGYVAMALSTDLVMDKDSVIYCAIHGGQVTVGQSWNDGYSSRRLAQEMEGLSDTNGVASSGEIDCNFTRRTKGRENQILDLDDSHVVFFALGKIGSGAQLSLTHHDKRFATDARLNFGSPNSTEGPLEPSSNWRARLHGTFMTAAWVGAVPFAIVVARYFRPLGGDGRWAGKQYWFVLHASATITAVVFVVIGFLLALSSANWDLFLHGPHTITGFLVFLFAFIQVGIGLARPDPNHNQRPIFNWVHRIFGLLIWILSIVSVVTGFFFMFSDRGTRDLTSLQTACPIVAIVFAVLVLVFLIASFFFEKTSSSSASAIALETKGDAASHAAPAAHAEPSRTNQAALLGGFAAIVFIVVLFLVVCVWAA